MSVDNWLQVCDPNLFTYIKVLDRIEGIEQELQTIKNTIGMTPELNVFIRQRRHKEVVRVVELENEDSVLL